MSGEAQTDRGKRNVPQGAESTERFRRVEWPEAGELAVCCALPCLTKSFAKEPGQQEL